MSRKISDKTKQLIQKLHNKGLSVREIARKVNVSYPIVWEYTKAKKRGFKSYSEYREYLVKKRGFESFYEYQNHLARQKGFGSYNKYREYLARQRGFESFYEYQNHLARQKGFGSYSEYQECLVNQRGFGSYNKYQKYLARQKGFESLSEYQENLVRQRGFESLSEYHEHLAKQRQKRPENRELSDLIKRSLKKLGKNQSWLASQIKVSRESVSKYAQGKRTPNREKLKRLFSVLDVPYRTLDDLL